MFERCYVVSLDRRPDRYERFVSGLPSDWPFPQPERFRAVDGTVVPHPGWWRQGAGAWGCYRSHTLLLEKCINEGVESVLLLEDDAVFPSGFTSQAVPFVQALPADWDMVYLGGQLLKVGHERPTRISELVYQPYNVNRTHAFGVRGHKFMRELYKNLFNFKTWKNSHHIDHRFGELHQSGKCRVFCPGSWLVGQADGPSDIKAGRTVFPERFWPGAVKAGGLDVSVMPEVQRVRPFVAVMGLHSSGSSATAGVLHHLGAFLGNSLTGFYGKDPERDCGFEAAALARICETAIPFPKTEIVQPLDIVTEELRRWVRGNSATARSRKTVAAGKYPMLCRLGPQLREAAGDDMKVIHIIRDPEESIQSIIRRCPRRPAALLESHQRWLWDGLQAFLAEMAPENVLAVTYDDLLHNTDDTVSRIATFSGMRPTEAQVARAVSSVDPKKRHVGV
jgi:hypothetical protein